MTTATFERDNDLYRVRITGHAGYADKDDIVCAACSTLASLLIQLMLTADQDGILDGLDWSKDSGDVSIDVRPSKGAEGWIARTIEIIATGYAMLEDQYPQYVTTKKYALQVEIAKPMLLR